MYYVYGKQKYINRYEAGGSIFQYQPGDYLLGVKKIGRILIRDNCYHFLLVWKVHNQANNTEDAQLRMPVADGCSLLYNQTILMCPTN